ncbi:hypothetical protein [Hymenobacter algoricola]|uniref:RHS repeat protein n=1 Tax=Hymenobacter algoricola TaxID=486267 RepID=A0ABP7MJR3_9BACT
MRCLFLAFLLPGLLTLLTLRAGQAQSPRFPGQGRTPVRPSYPSETLVEPQFLTRITIGPTVPGGHDADGSIAAEPDSSQRRQYARHRVRAVLKVRLNRRGEGQDTVETQTIDRQGRRTATGPRRREWSYNAQGQCTALVEYPAADRPHTLITTYNPTLRRGRQEVLQPSGTRTVVSEKQLYQSADTLLTEVVGHSLAVGRYLYPAYYQRSIRLRPHPDTVLTLTGFYGPDHQLTGSRADYWLYRRGHLTESGRLELGRAAKAQHLKLPPGQTVPLLTYPQALAALRRGQGLQPQRRLSYDARQQLTRQEITVPLNQPGQVAQNVMRYTYNSLGQLIGREASFSSIRAATQAAYTVFSYAPTGLLLGETSDARSSKPVFYRYLYQYYD